MPVRGKPVRIRCRPDPYALGPARAGEDPIREAPPAMSVRRRAAALAFTAVLCGAAAPAAVAAPSPSPSSSAPDLPEGLYGTKDPTYDGVWRQSLAFLAQKIELVTPATKSVDWLVGQQCDSGAFASYRDASRPCDDKTVADTNATAAAVQAVVELGVHREVVDNGVAWLKSVQNDDGGWGYNPGSPSDANSTAVVNGALARAGVPLADLTKAGGKTPYTALQTFALPCGGEDGGAFAYQPDKTGKLAANADATAAAVLGSMGKGMAAGNYNAVKAPVCTKGDGLTPEQSAPPTRRAPTPVTSGASTWSGSSTPRARRPPPRPCPRRPRRRRPSPRTRAATTRGSASGGSSASASPSARGSDSFSAAAGRTSSCEPPAGQGDAASRRRRPAGPAGRRERARGRLPLLVVLGGRRREGLDVRHPGAVLGPAGRRRGAGIPLLGERGLPGRGAAAARPGLRDRLRGHPAEGRPQADRAGHRPGHGGGRAGRGAGAGSAHRLRPGRTGREHGGSPRLGGEAAAVRQLRDALRHLGLPALRMR